MKGSNEGEPWKTMLYRVTWDFINFDDGSRHSREFPSLEEAGRFIEDRMGTVQSVMGEGNGVKNLRLVVLETTLRTVSVTEYGDFLA